MTNSIKNGMFTGRKAVEVYRLTTLAKMLECYGRHKIRLNPQVAPTRMIRMAEKVTGETFGRNYLDAARATLLVAHKLLGEVQQEMTERGEL